MAIGFSERVDIRPYSGYDDPSLPTATWVAQAGRAGDASGGNINLDFLFQRDDDALTSELYSLEQIAIDVTSGTAQGGSIQTINMDDLAPNRPLTDQLWSFSLNPAISGLASLRMDLSMLLPLWLGSPNRAEGDSGIRFFLTNVNLRLYQIVIQGYQWGPRSILAPGGPRRPVGGLFTP